MTLTGFIAYSIALAIAAAIPGPGVAALVARALGTGFASTVPMVIGLTLGDIVYLVAVLLGLSVVAQTFGTVFLVIKWIGVAYLCYLAYRLWTAGLMSLDVKAKKKSDGPWASFLAGFLVTLGNPKVMIFYIAITPTVIDLRSVTLIDGMILVALTIAVLMVVLIPYLVLAARARGLFSKPKTLHAINRIAAGFLGGAAAAIALRT